ncbi:hypothetical protein GCM10007880_61430 [Mesorhizobium amorphae]|uniref:hypothetical protein n=1 Tax=Mesorhizobium amorphae TaxID=71433 RepID=UPI00235BC03E|nr:hypothetical protein [Mesorhizobium amorphae]GLR45625.1 hypothetical protein GCM10007880_61430 [Mesorhizobium amorphae]
MTGRINRKVIIPVALWLLATDLSTPHMAIEPTCNGGSCSEKIAVAYQLLSLSTATTGGYAAAEGMGSRRPRQIPVPKSAITKA